ncbi:MAG: small subunit ribosomal protein [Frankiaceae bacterium]|nr:small subunit ribosomal protein [Frankiaceae bacterium]
MATKIKLMRLGKMRAPFYRVVVADSRTKRDGRSIETIGKYDPKADPSIITIDNERALYWLGVGAQPTEAVAALLRVTGTWQQFKGLPAPPPMLMAADKVDKKSVFEDAARSAAGLKTEDDNTAKARPAKKVADKAAKDKPVKTADQADAEAAAEGKTLTEAREDGSPAAEGLDAAVAETPAAETSAAETPAAETPAAEAPVAETPAAEAPAAEEAAAPVDATAAAAPADETGA